MSRILVLGGYGGFGGRISRRLRARGHEVIVAGRSLARARDFCAGGEGLIPLALDRGGDLALGRHRPALVVDAAGPFQHSRLDVPEACIAAGIPYLDIADARDFVARVAALDATAVAIVTGASSVPALSGAVARRLAAGMDEVRAVEIAISASNRAGAGASVAAAILSYAGRPIRLWRGQAWRTGFGWGEMRRERFEAAGGPSLAGRRVALCEVPDLDLLPERLPGRPAVTFRAGTELRLHNLGLAAAARLVRSGLIRDLARWAPRLERARRLTARFGSDRSAMIVRLFGTAGGGRVERRWTLIAEQGDGPEIPALAVPILAERLLAGAVPPGARDAGALLDLDDFAPAFAGLAVRHETREIALPPPLYARAMGRSPFGRLPPAVRALHQVLRDGGAHGAATVTRGRNPIARLIGWIVGFPPAGEHELHLHFEERDGVETWTRRFSGKGFRSRLALRGPLLCERFGPLTFGFELPADESGLTMILRRWWIGPIPMPLPLGPRCAAREYEEDGRFRFDVSIGLPLIGLVAHYRGWLAPDIVIPDLIRDP
ncbi:MAG TPA: DUF4166 domain-containing protein [Allosphingosinicella sp.]|nr:DUF4166 domain-containing protein [Allosphingosinicella sp.]